MQISSSKTTSKRKYSDSVSKDKTVYSPRKSSVVGWDSDFFTTVGLEDIVEENFVRIGQRFCDVGGAVGTLCEKSANELGLNQLVVVASALIDAHAGAIGMLGSNVDSATTSITERLALICGTSSCHMALSDQERLANGIWGPYYSAAVPGCWLLEGGQSSTGSLLDCVIQNHACYPQLKDTAVKCEKSVYEVLNDKLLLLANESDLKSEGISESLLLAQLTADVHVLPYFHGNRSPRADPSLVGIMTGLNLDLSLNSLAIRYLACVQAIAYGTRHIISTMKASGQNIQLLLACGGLSKNPLFLQQHADVTGLPVALPKEPEAVLLGSAINAASAFEESHGKPGSRLVETMKAMSAVGKTVNPDPSTRNYHGRKYAVFMKMYDDLLQYRSLMK